MKQISKRLLSWASLLEDQAREQAIASSQLPFVHPHVALMPDAHWGMGSTVGSVIPTLGVVIPAAVEADIGCGMSATRTDLAMTDLPNLPPLAGLRRLIERDVPVSMGKYQNSLSATAQCRVRELERHSAIQGVDPDGYSPNWRMQLGTLGSGNHFIEVCADESDRLWVFLHSGSRGVGNKIAMHHVKIAQKQCARWHIQLPHKDLAYLPEGDAEFWEYIRDLRWAQAFARENRAEMVDRVIACMAEWAHSGIAVEETISTHHNYTERERHFGKDVWLTRKGAINAEKGRRGLIPGSMGTHGVGSEMTATESYSEDSMLSLLRKRYAAKNGNGPEWAYLEKVRDAPGFDAKRTADAMALSLWQSRGCELHGFEVKVSRADWRRELADPAKAEGWHAIVDRWWIVAPKGIVPRAELPVTWGLLETGARGLAVTVQAPLLQETRLPLERRHLVPILRAAGAGLSFTPDETALKAAREEGWESGRKSAEENGAQWKRMYEREVEDVSRARRAVSILEKVLGVSVTEWGDVDGARAVKVAAALKLVLDGEDAVKRARHAVQRMVVELERQALLLRALVNEKES